MTKNTKTKRKAKIENEGELIETGTYVLMKTIHQFAIFCYNNGYPDRESYYSYFGESFGIDTTLNYIVTNKNKDYMVRKIGDDQYRILLKFTTSKIWKWEDNKIHTKQEMQELVKQFNRHNNYEWIQLNQHMDYRDFRVLLLRVEFWNDEN